MFTPTVKNRLARGPRKRVENREERIPVTKAASICLDGQNLMVPCTIRDINSKGARMSVTNAESLCDVILLIARSENLVARAKIAWRKQHEIGVRFLRKGQLFEEERFRKEQIHSYQQEREAIERKHQEQQAAYDAHLEQERQRQNQILQHRLQLMQQIGMDPQQPLTEDALKAAYRKEAMRRHPDQGGTLEAFQELNGIYQYLMSQIIPPQPAQAAIAL